MLNEMNQRNELVAATKIWRRMYPSEEHLARKGLEFMKARWEG